MHQGSAHTFSRQSRRAAARKAAPMLACARVSVRPCIREITTADSFGNALGESIAQSASGNANGSTWSAEKQTALDNALNNPSGLIADDASPLTQAQRYANAYGGNAANVADRLQITPEQAIERYIDAQGRRVARFTEARADSTGNETFLPNPTVIGTNAQGGEVWSSGSETYPVNYPPLPELDLMMPTAYGGSGATLSASPELGLRDGMVDSMRNSSLGKSNAGQVLIGGVNAWLHLPETLIASARGLATLPITTAQAIAQYGAAGAALNAWTGLVDGARRSVFDVAYGRDGEARGAALFGIATTAPLGLSRLGTAGGTALQAEAAVLQRIGQNARMSPGWSTRFVELQEKAEANALRRLQEMEAATPGAHYLEKHGAQLNLQSQFDRAAYGVNPTTGVSQGVPSAATRFLSHRDQLNVITRAENIYRLTGDPDLARSPIPFQSAIGSGFERGTLNYGVQYSGRVFVNLSTGKAITAFPVWGQ